MKLCSDCPHLSRAAGSDYPLNSATALALGKPRICQKTLLPAPFPASAGTWHSLLPSLVKALLPGMQVRRVKSQNNVSPLPPRRVLPCIFNSLILLSMAYKAPCNLAPFTSFLTTLCLPLTPPCSLHLASDYGSLLLLLPLPRCPCLYTLERSSGIAMCIGPRASLEFEPLLTSCFTFANLTC